MQTSLPNLPFPDYGDAVLDASGIHSSAKSRPRTYPRTDLKTLTPWTSFPNDIHQAILAATPAHLPLNTPFHIKGWTWETIVENELKIHFHALATLLEPAADVLGRLGVKGRFVTPGGGNSAIVGDPDFSWITSSGLQPHPKVIVEYKTWWAADLADLVAAFSRAKEQNGPLSKQALDALQQIYGYMTFNDNRFGILTNWKHALFLRRAETPDRKTLQYYLVELDRVGQPISMLKAFVGMVLLAEADWFYSSPTLSSAPPNRTFGRTTWKERKAAIDIAEKYSMQPVNGAYLCRAIDFRLCHFKLSSTRRGASGCVVPARLLAQTVGVLDLEVFCKVIDALRYPDAASSLIDEGRAYAALQDLQGQVIPTVHGFYEIWGILQFLALEPVGNAIPEDEQIDQTLRTNMKAALQRIHNDGYIHGDIARRNFCRKDSGEVFLVDLERCRLSVHPSELDDEMQEVDEL